MSQSCTPADALVKRDLSEDGLTANVDASICHVPVDAKSSTEALRAKGCSAWDLRVAGRSLQDLRDGGFTTEQLRSASASSTDLRAIGVSIVELREGGFPASELRADGLSAAALCTAGFSAKSLSAAGFSSRQISTAGYSTAELHQRSYLSEALMGANGLYGRIRSWWVKVRQQSPSPRKDGKVHPTFGRQRSSHVPLRMRSEW